ncbi:MAG: NFACT RNA binding domain-containing protein [Candidatus Marinimicrobia bacterium]|nr:NFACT RNA binding domain-containing protein [Candidatus Neomarinimicrobiota bacterium]
MKAANFIKSWPALWLWMHYWDEHLKGAQLDIAYTFRKARLDIHFSNAPQVTKLGWEKQGNQAIISASNQVTLPKRRVEVLKRIPQGSEVAGVKIHAQDRLLRFDLTNDFQLILGCFPAVLNVYLYHKHSCVDRFLKQIEPAHFSDNWLSVNDSLPASIPGGHLSRHDLEIARHGITLDQTTGELAFDSTAGRNGLPIDELVLAVFRSGQKPKQAPVVSIKKTAGTVLKRWQVKLTKVRTELQEALLWPDLEIRLQAFQIGLGMGKLTSSNELHLPAELSPTGSALTLYLEDHSSLQQAIESTAKKIRKFKLKIGQLEAIIPQIQTDIHDLEQLLEQDDNTALRTYLLTKGEALDRSGRRQTERKPYKKYQSPGGYDILVGRGSSDNDVLTFKVAGKNDWWFHARQIRGSHVILRTGNQQPQQPDIVSAAKHAARNSKAKHSGIVVVQYCQRKHLSKPKGSPPGTVLVHHEKSITIDLDQVK